MKFVKEIVLNLIMIAALYRLLYLTLTHAIVGIIINAVVIGILLICIGLYFYERLKK